MPLSRRYSRHQDRLSTRYSPVRHSTQDRSPFRVRLACVKHAASVRSEPGSNSPVHYPSQSQFDWTIIQFKTKYFLARSFTVQFSKINSCERLAQAMRRHLKRFLFWCQPLFSLPSFSDSAGRQATRRQNTGTGVRCQRLFPGHLPFCRFSSKAIEMTYFFSLLFLADLTYHVIFMQNDCFLVWALTTCRGERRRTWKCARNC